jgi:large subunit ribosomal protein L21
MVVSGDDVKVGQPVLENAKVIAKIAEQGRAKKVIVFKKKRRKGYRLKNGHRQSFTALKIEEISA